MLGNVAEGILEKQNKFSYACDNQYAWHINDEELDEGKHKGQRRSNSKGWKVKRFIPALNNEKKAFETIWGETLAALCPW